MYRDWQSIPLEGLGLLRAHGADTRTFLQGQLSNDVALLSPQRALLAGYHNPQGRVIALMQLLQGSAQEVLAVLPRELIAGVCARLQKYVLRSKLKLADASATYAVRGISAAPTAQPPAGWPAQLHAAQARGPAQVVCVGVAPWRWLMITPREFSAPELPGAATGSEQAWRAQLIAAGEPQVYAATSEAFVAQMLNLDVLGAIAFDKGCYTGQEVIARAHYRGRIKRRLQRFLSVAAAQLAPGDSGTLGDGRSYQVVDASMHPDGRSEFLAVAALASAAAEPAAGGALEAVELELPYALPQ